MTPAKSAPYVPGFQWLMEQEGRTGSAAAGKVLLEELNCTACHAPAAGANWITHPAPRLGTVVIDPPAVYEFLRNPHTFKPGTSMPNALKGRPDQDRLAALLAAFLVREHPTARVDGSADRGRDLFHSIGCAGCHRTPVSDRVTGVRSERGVPLELGLHYELNSLVQFLRSPQLARPGGRMPGMHLSAVDANDLALYLNGLAPHLEAIPAVESDGTAARWFRELGCEACHDLGHGLFPMPGARPLIDLATDKGCLSQDPRWPAMDYNFSPEQRRDLQTALNQPTTDSPQDELHRLMARFNCYGCHERNGVGGPDDISLFTGEDALGPEGRLPPDLNDAGRKLRPEWMAGILSGRERARLYLKTRMPEFPTEQVGDFIHLARDVDGSPHAGSELVGGDGVVGGQLVGGEGLSCITCHRWGDRHGLAMDGLDLRQLPQRLQPGYFRRWLLEPASIRPGTLMPAFFGENRRRDILDGDVDQQIASIWKFLTEGATEPTGYPPQVGEFELFPTNKPVVFRGFIQGAGTHGVAVGFSAGAHAVFDASEGRPVLAWRGRFLDAYDTWFSRTQPPLLPLGSDLVALPKAGLRSAPSDPSRYRWRGYKLDRDGVPVFLYDIGTARVEDKLVPNSRHISRTIKVTTAQSALQWSWESSDNVRVRTAARPTSDHGVLDLPPAPQPFTIQCDYFWP